MANPALSINNEHSDFLGIHVDNLLYVAKEDDGLTSWLGIYFKVNNFETLRHLVSIELTWTNESVSLSPTAYLRRIIKKYLHSGAKSHVIAVLLSQSPLQRDQPKPPTNVKEYQSVIGSLLYAAIITRPDILFLI